MQANRKDVWTAKDTAKTYLESLRALKDRSGNILFVQTLEMILEIIAEGEEPEDPVAVKREMQTGFTLAMELIHGDGRVKDPLVLKDLPDMVYGYEVRKETELRDREGREDLLDQTDQTDPAGPMDYMDEGAEDMEDTDPLEDTEPLDTRGTRQQGAGKYSDGTLAYRYNQVDRPRSGGGLTSLPAQLALAGVVVLMSIFGG